MTSEAIVTVAQSGLEQKRAEAKGYLGQHWVNHPDYKFSPRHSNNPDIYAPARQSYLLSVQTASACDRLSNPAFHTAERIRKALSIH